MSTLPLTWSPPETERGRVILTRSWRIITYSSAPSVAARLYVALAPESLIEAYGALFPLLEERQLSHRHARSPQVLREMERIPGWAGKSVVIDLGEEQDLPGLVAEVDDRLAGLGITGPPLLAQARPLGGRSGLLFRRRDEVAAAGDERRERLARLLGEEGGS